MTFMRLIIVSLFNSNALEVGLKILLTAYFKSYTNDRTHNALNNLTNHNA